MDFLIVSEDLDEARIERVSRLRTSMVEESTVRIGDGKLSCLLFGDARSVSKNEKTVYFFDGQFSYRQLFYHSLSNNNPIDQAVECSLRCTGEIANGIYCVGKIEQRPDGMAFSVANDWLGQYPIFLWQKEDRFALSNNLAMLEEVVGAERSILPAIENLFFGSCFSNKTHLKGVWRLSFGKYLQGTAGKLQIINRPDHQFDPSLSYQDCISLAREEILKHIEAVHRQEQNRVYYLTDLTGGGDSRAVLSFLLEVMESDQINFLTLGRHPLADANVAGMLAEKYRLGRGHFPVYHKPQDYAVRCNAALTGGGRDSGIAIYPVAFPDLVHFKGSYGELGGVVSGGVDYFQLLRKETFFPLGRIFYFFSSLVDNSFRYFSSGPKDKLQRFVDLICMRRQQAGALELLTQEAIVLAAQEFRTSLGQILEEGYSLEQVFAESYLRSRSPWHFGIASWAENKNRILPDPLANRWLVEARRRLSSTLHSRNKVILDLILSSRYNELAFLPMANKKWHSEAVPPALRKKLKKQLVVDGDFAPLSKNQGPLFTPVMVDSSDFIKYSPLKLKKFAASDNPAPKAGHLATNKAFLDFFLENVSPNSDLWRYFERRKLIDAVAKEASSFRADGIDINAMGIVASALTWVSRLEINPAVNKSDRFLSRLTHCKSR